MSTDSGVSFDAMVRIDTPREADYYRHGGILQYVLRQMLGGVARCGGWPRGATLHIGSSA